MTGEIICRSGSAHRRRHEEVLAAHRWTGTVILPKRNEQDLDDVPMRSKDAKFIYVETVDEVLDSALESNHQPELRASAARRGAAVRINRRARNKLLKRKPRQGKQRPMAKVLLAEDDFTMVSLLKTLLKMEGFEVTALDTGSDVPAQVGHERPDILFLDVHFGNQSGVEIIQAIRKNKDLSDLRVVMTSGMSMQEECMRAGANAFLLKPFSPDDLIRMLKL
jgi:CheY-like chemotaxis protein